jgi:hypothetical protein
MLDKIMFWKKKDEFGKLEESPLPKESKFGEEPAEMEAPEFRPPEEFKPSAPPLGAQPQAAMGPGPQFGAKDFELINAKLDAVKASIESINQRLANIERIASESSEPQKKKTW